MNDIPIFNESDIFRSNQERNTVILFSEPRTGSNYVAKQIANAGFGTMKEWMFSGHHYSNQLTLNSLHSLIAMVQQDHYGRTFNTKIMWSHLLNDLLPILPYEAWESWFGQLHIMTIEREDKMNQAVSFQKCFCDNKWAVLNETENLTEDLIIDKYGDTTINQIINRAIWGLARHREEGKKWLEDNNVPVMKHIRYSNLYSDTKEAVTLLKEKVEPVMKVPRIPWKSHQQANNVNELLKEFMVETLGISEKTFDKLSLDDLHNIQRDIEESSPHKTFKEFMS